MSTEPGNNAKNNFQKRFFKLMKNVIFRKKYGKCEKSHRDIKLATTEARKNYLV